MVTIQQLGQRCTPSRRLCLWAGGGVSERHRPPVHSLHTSSRPSRLAVAYFRHNVKCLGGHVGVGIALALGLMHSREAGADDVQGRTPGITLREERASCQCNRHHCGVPRELCLTRRVKEQQEATMVEDCLGPLVDTSH